MGLMMLTAILILAILGVGYRLDRQLQRVVSESQAVRAELKQLRLASRARVRTMTTQSGARTEEQELARLGRTTVGKRVVVGGDPEAAQYAGLNSVVDKYIRGDED